MFLFLQIKQTNPAIDPSIDKKTKTGPNQSMESTLAETSSLLQNIYPSLASFEKASTSTQAQDVEAYIKRQLELITKNCERLDQLVQKEPISKRRNAKYRVDQLKYDCNHIRASFNTLQQIEWAFEIRHQYRERQLALLQASFNTLQQRQAARARSEQNRAELLQRKFAPNQTPDSTTVDLQGHEAEHNSRLGGVDRQVDDLLATGMTSLENLRSQHLSLKDVRRRILDTAQTLGLSNSVMRFIEQRTAQDRYILFGGMATTLVIMYFLYVMLKH